MNPIRDILGILVITAAIYAFMVFVEGQVVLYEMVVPPANVLLEDWIESFKFWGSIGIGVSLFAALFWYVLGQWFFNLDSWSGANKRTVWGLILLVPLVALVLGVIFTEQAQQGAIFAYLFYALNWLLCYYFSTALFSPASFKYTPLGAKAMRRW